MNSMMTKRTINFECQHQGAKKIKYRKNERVSLMPPSLQPCISF